MKNKSRFVLLLTFTVIFSCYCQAVAGTNAGLAFDIWPDTGQIWCYDDEKSRSTCPKIGFPLQDAEHHALPRSYTKLDSNGEDLLNSANDWAMVRDDATGLIWEAKQTVDSLADYDNPHDGDNTYTWCDTNSETNGGNEGVCRGLDTEEFINTLNDNLFGGYDDWRLPTIKELSSLVDSGRTRPVIDWDYFNTKYLAGAYYWSATTGPNSNQIVRIVKFYRGETAWTVKALTSFGYTRAVRGGSQVTTDRFIDNNDGTVSDITTGLMWQKNTSSPMQWAEALQYSNNLELAEYSDWRLPSRNELQSLVDYTKYDPSIDTPTFPDTYSSHYWTSTSERSDNSGYHYAYYVNFHEGNVDPWNGNKYNTYYARSVRDMDSSIFYLNVNVSGNGSGTISSIPDGINCGDDCWELYVEDTVVTIIATESPGSLFTGWSGSCSGNGTCQVSMDTHISVIATFDKIVVPAPIYLLLLK